MGKGNKSANKLARTKQLHAGKSLNTIQKKAGRPSKYNEETVKKMMDVFKMGGSVEEATSYAGITRQTYYEWVEKHPKLVTEVEQARIYPIIVARNIVVDTMTRNRDVNTAKWYLEKTIFRNTNHSGSEGSSGHAPQVSIVFPDLVRQRYEQVAEDIIGELAEDDEPSVSSVSDESLPVKE